MKRLGLFAALLLASIGTSPIISCSPGTFGVTSPTEISGEDAAQTATSPAVTITANPLTGGTAGAAAAAPAASTSSTKVSLTQDQINQIAGAVTVASNAALTAAAQPAWIPLVDGLIRLSALVAAWFVRPKQTTTTTAAAGG